MHIDHHLKMSKASYQWSIEVTAIYTQLELWPEYSLAVLMNALRELYPLGHAGKPPTLLLHTKLKHQFEDYAPMAPKNAAKKNEFRQVEFVRSELDAERKKAFVKWYDINAPEIPAYVQQIIQMGIKLGVSHNEQMSSTTCSATCWDEKSQNYACCISSMHDDWLTAVAITVYKITVVFDNGAWSDGIDLRWG
jgi:hypothetical protein